MPSIDVARTIAADPTSGVLLLAAPSSAELWPGVSMLSNEPGDHAHVAVDALDEPVLVRTTPPQRTPTAYVIRFTFAMPGRLHADGELRLSYAPVGADDSPVTTARLTLRMNDADPSFEQAVAAGAAQFLDNLAAAAEGRSRAA
jgi:hypothetical protein